MQLKSNRAVYDILVLLLSYPEKRENLEVEKLHVDEDEEEEKPKYPLKLRTNTRQETRDITPQFQCCVCHSNVYGEKEDSPCLLVHTDCDFHPCILFVKLS